MGDKSKIEWTDASWNPIRGCSRVSEGCRNCYAERQAARQAGRGGAYEGLVILGSKPPQWTGVVRQADDKTLGLPLRWKSPRRIFVNSMSDLFHEKVRVESLVWIFSVMDQCPQHIFQILTKRPDRMFDWLSGHNDYRNNPRPHIWFGISAEDQSTFDDRHAYLRNTPAAVRFISYEPALGPVDLKLEYAQLIDWVIAGGESGPGARPARPDWFRSVRDQCVAAGVPFFFKQWGEWGPIPSERFKAAHYQWVRKDGLRHGMCEESSGDICMALLHKKAAGRLLDGREWNEFPEAK